MPMRGVPFLLTLLINVPVYASSIDYTNNNNWNTRSLIFQNTVLPPIFDSEQVLSTRAGFFYHPAGHRSTIEISAKVPAIPMGLMGRISRIPNPDTTTQNLTIETGFFWYGITDEFLGQLGITYIQEGVTRGFDKRFIVPQMTLRTLFTRGLIESVQHISAILPIEKNGTNRLHTNHKIAYIFNLNPKLFLSVGGQLDFYVLMGDETASEYTFIILSSGLEEKEYLQFLLGPVATLMHKNFGHLSLSISQSFLVSQETSGSSYNFHLFQIPAINLAYSVGF